MKTNYINIISGMKNIDKDKLYYESDYAKIYCDDILSTDIIPENSIDLIVTSPPYNLDIDYKSHEDNLEYFDYLRFTENWLRKCFKMLKGDGRMCLNIPLDTNMGEHQSVASDVVTIAKAVGYRYFSSIVWDEGNVSNRLAWGSWMSASAPCVIAPVELIIILYKESWKKLSDGKNDIERDEFIEWTNGLWKFGGESKKRIGHPAPFPIELPKRCIKLFSYVGDTVLDPFMGSGTTLIAGEILKRKTIGIDKEIQYCDLAYHRILKEIKNYRGNNYV